jgi:hypothetical protein
MSKVRAITLFEVVVRDTRIDGLAASKPAGACRANSNARTEPTATPNLGAGVIASPASGDERSEDGDEERGSDLYESPMSGTDVS